ncbi:MAG: hypothetical protein J0L58_18165 [Burkholderiales bacterium]|uniref:hypothetical protein n=1 Tax=Inhella sp. TaxID=1921806 RepID=UPI001AC47C92|nr:hypothetical protein [Burkholderiales bacterium]
MGWLNTLLLGDIGNRLDIGEVEDEVARMQAALQASWQHKARHEDRLARLERENGELKLCVVALMRELAGAGQLDLGRLQALVRAIDAEDGRLDGQYQGRVGQGG